MAWTAPRTWVSGELVTAALMNSAVRDNMSILKTAINNSGELEFTDAAELTIASGVITVTQNYHKVDTESDASSDDLDTITVGTNVAAGFILHLRVESAARTVVIKNGTGGSDNLDIGSDVTLDESYKTYSLVYDGSNWRPWTFAEAATFASLSPLTTRGDVLYASSGTVTGTRLAVGSAGTLLGTDGTDVAWKTNVDIPGTLDVTSATTLDSTLTTAGRTLCGTGVTTGDGILAAATTSNHCAVFESVRDDDNGCTINIRQASASPGNNDQPARIHVYARDNGTTFRNTHRLDFQFDTVAAGNTYSSFKFGTMNNSSSGTNTTASLTAAGVWTDASDEEAKHYTGPITDRGSTGTVLDRITRLKTECYCTVDIPEGETPPEYHAGPSAQQWWTEFGLGQDPETHEPGIAAKDLAAVALAGLQEVIAQNKELKQRVAILEDKISED
jgi:hypothetical protein